MKKPFVAGLGVFVVAACLLGLTLGVVSVKRVLTQAGSHAPAPALSDTQSASLNAAIALMQRRGLKSDAALASTLLRQGDWRAASPNDASMAQAERVGDTPYAYTLADGKRVLAVVLAPRFFTETTPAARAALMIHEMGHVRSYQATGRSDEYDGYKREYDTHNQLGLTERDSLPYFAMLDGVTEYVVPRNPAYKAKPDIRGYVAQWAGSEKAPHQN